MIRGKKVMRPIRKLNIQDKADMNEDLIKDFIDENEELTLLMAVNCIVTLAEDSELSSSFFEKADRFITYFSERQGITKIQAVLLALFIESSAAGNKSDLSDVAHFLNCNNVQVLQYKSEVDDLVRNEVVRLGLYGDKVKVMAAIRIFLHIVPRQGHDVTATEACQTRENGSSSQNVVLARGLI